MLITSQINECKGCADLISLIYELDCYIAKKSAVRLYNMKYALRHKINELNLKNAIQLKSILIKRTYNPSYLCDFDIDDIINLAKQSMYR